jgi:hypothetical protein
MLATALHLHIAATLLAAAAGPVLALTGTDAPFARGSCDNALLTGAFACPSGGGCCVGACCAGGCCPTLDTCVAVGTSDEACCPVSDATLCGTAKTVSSKLHLSPRLDHALFPLPLKIRIKGCLSAYCGNLVLTTARGFRTPEAVVAAAAAARASRYIATTVKTIPAHRELSVVQCMGPALEVARDPAVAVAVRAVALAGALAAVLGALQQLKRQTAHLQWRQRRSRPPVPMPVVRRRLSL